MNKLFDAFTSHVDENLSRTMPNISGTVEYLINLHLDPKHYPMPILLNEPDWYIQKLSEKDFSAINSALKFESTKTMQGIIRVLVRTHLNRQGIGHVVRGSRDKTLTPRVLKAFEGDVDFSALKEPKKFSALWEGVVSRFPDLYDEIDRKSISILEKLDAEHLSSSALVKAEGVHDNWAKVFTGIYTGIQFLDTEYELNPQALWNEMDAASQQSGHAKKLIKKLKENVHQYGTALAGSFLADLGHEGFVKADTHVIDCAASVLKQESVSAEKAINLVYKLGEQLEMPPRMIDKIFYLGCSGNFYLTGFKVRNAAEFKQNFLQRLSTLNLHSELL